MIIQYLAISFPHEIGDNVYTTQACRIVIRNLSRARASQIMTHDFYYIGYLIVTGIIISSAVQITRFASFLEIYPYTPPALTVTELLHMC
jgi:hypothetical protein